MKLPEEIPDEMVHGVSTCVESRLEIALQKYEGTAFSKMTISWWANLFAKIVEEAMQAWNDEAKWLAKDEKDDEEELESGAFDDADEEDEDVLERIEKLEGAMTKVVTILGEL